MAIIYRKSQKLFYEDYAYKVRLKMPTGYNQYIKVLLRYTKDSTVEKKIAGLQKNVMEDKYGWFENLSNTQLTAMADFIRYARKNNMIKDCRFNEYWRLITFYSNNAKYLEDMEKHFECIVDYIEKPANQKEMDLMFDKHNTKFVDRLPYNKFRYACYIDYYSSRYADDNICQKFLKWSEPFGKRIKTANRYSLGRKFEVFSKFWVQDLKLLHMVQLYLGKKIIKTETYRLRSEMEHEDTNNKKDT